METQSLLATIARLKAQLADQEVELNDIKQERDDYREDLSRNRTKAAKLTSLAEAQASQLRDLERKLERFRREADSDVPRVKQACDIGGTGITRGPAKEDSNIQVERVETTTSLKYMDGAQNDTSDGASMLASAAPNDFASSIQMTHGRQEHTVMSKRRVSDTETHPFDDRQTKRVKAERSQSPDIALSLLQTFRPPTAPYGDGRVPYLDAHTGSSVHSLLQVPTMSATPSELSGSVRRPAQVFGAHMSNSPLLSSANKATAMLGNRPMFFVSSSSSLPRDATADDIAAAIAAANYAGQGRYSRTGHQQVVSDDKPQKPPSTATQGHLSSTPRNALVDQRRPFIIPLQRKILAA